MQKKIDLKKIRKQHHMVNEKLCRSRRLFYSMYYGQLVRFIGANKDAARRMLALGIFMRDKGFYAAGTSHAALALSVARNLARVREEKLGKSQVVWRTFHEARIPAAVDQWNREQRGKIVAFKAA